MDKTLVFIDDGFLSKLSKHFGNGKYLKIHRKDFSKYVKLTKEDFVEISK